MTPGGSIVGVDVAEGMLAIADDHAKQRGVGDVVSFELGDMHDLRFDDGHFDAVVCSFALFFAKDVTAVGRELWRVVAPGGRLVIATIGEQFFEPLWTEFRREVAAHRPDLQTDMPWERRQVADGGTLCGLLAAGDVPVRSLEVEDVKVPIDGPDDWWTIATGTGIRRAVEEMGPEVAAVVRKSNANWIAENDVSDVVISANYVVAEHAPQG